METSLKTGFAQIFSRCPKNLSCPKFGGAAAPLAPPARTPMIRCILQVSTYVLCFQHVFTIGIILSATERHTFPLTAHAKVIVINEFSV